MALQLVRVPGEPERPLLPGRQLLLLGEAVLPLLLLQPALLLQVPQVPGELPEQVPGELPELPPELPELQQELRAQPVPEPLPLRRLPIIMRAPQWRPRLPLVSSSS